jgi:methylated-DNA-[protein]-cysteine S-methyltransferase
VETDLVDLAVSLDGNAVLAIDLNGSARRGPESNLERRVARELVEYLAGARREFDFPIDLHGTPFEMEVWTALQNIPYGSTVTYGELATRLGRPGAARAVGSANGRNPIPIVVPCHRVIAAGGKLGGYGGGLTLKRQLLDLESGQRQLPERV